MRLSFKSIIMLLAALAALAAPSMSGLIEDTNEEAIGKEYDKRIKASFGFYADQELQDYVAQVGAKVLAGVDNPIYEFQFKVVDDETLNAFALPGGYVYITRGMLAALNNEAELAGVLGHEIGHIIHHHSVQQMNKNNAQALIAVLGLAASHEIRNNAPAWLTLMTSLGQQIITGYGREMEMESDQEGLLLSHAAGYDPGAVTAFLRSMQRVEKLGFRTYHGFMATHPDTRTRIVEAELKSSLLQARGKNAELLQERYFGKIDGLMYGKAKWKGKTRPPYTITIHTVQEGDTFRSLAEIVSKDLGKAFEIAAINGMDLSGELEPGMKLKVMVPAPTVDVSGMTKEENENEISIRIGDGKGGEAERGKGEESK